MIIDHNKPLPNRLDTEYWETVAKLILEKIFPYRFVNLSVEGEKPDLHNDIVGVEVTGMANRELESLYAEYMYCDDAQKDKAYKQIKKLGGRIIMRSCLMHPLRNRNLNLIYDRIDNKTKKLNDGYKIYKRNYLFIFTEDYIDDEELSDINANIVRVSSSFTYKYNSVFLCCLGGDLYEFCIDQKKNKHIYDSHVIIQDSAIDARAVLENKYNN